MACTGIEDKMGIHGSPTCSISLGSKRKCRGLLLGEENQGMRIMFHMMNEVRLEVGTQAFTHASCSYLYALDYASQRIQGRALENSADHTAPQVPIICHPDVRRMLLKMKAFVEGMRSLLFFTAFSFDKIKCAKDSEEKKYYRGLTEILTPVVKAYCSEKGFEVCVTGMQIFGGYGYTKEYPMEQLVRDCKICSIYEGSNGIQAMDFLGRKILMEKGTFLKSLITEIRKTIDQAKRCTNYYHTYETDLHGADSDETNPDGTDPDGTALNDMADKVGAAADRFYNTAIAAGKAVKSSEFKSAFSVAHPLMEAAGDVIMAWMLLWRASAAAPALAKIVKSGSMDEVIQKNKNAAFYHGKIMTADFFINTILPVTMGKLTAVHPRCNPAVNIYEKSF